MSKRKTELHATLFLIHVALGILAVILIMEFPQPWRDIPFTAVFVSLLVWPTILFRRVRQQSEYKKEEEEKVP